MLERVQVSRKDVNVASPMIISCSKAVVGVLQWRIGGPGSGRGCRGSVGPTYMRKREERNERKREENEDNRQGKESIPGSGHKSVRNTE